MLYFVACLFEYFRANARLERKDFSLKFSPKTWYFQKLLLSRKKTVDNYLKSCENLCV